MDNFRIIRSIWELILSKIRNTYLKGISMMMFGNVTSLVITVIASPIITRLYSPKEFGIFALYSSLSAITAVIATFRYEHTFFLIEENEIYDAFYLITIINVVINILISLIFYSLKILLNINILNGSSYIWVILLPSLAFLQAQYFCLKYYLSNNANYKIIVKALILKTIIANSIIISFGFYKISYGLIWGTLAGQTVETVLLLIIFIKITTINKKKIVLIDLAKFFRKYKDFPKYSLPAELMNVYTNQNPIILLTFFFNEKVAGYYALVQRIIGVPMKIIANSTGEVFRREASIALKEKTGLYVLIKKTFFGLLLISIIPFIIISFYAKEIISLVFGNVWSDAGHILQILMFYFILQFSISPLGYALYIMERQKVNLLWQILLLCTTTFSLAFGGYMKDQYLAITMFSFCYGLMYLFYYYLIIKNSRYMEKNC